MKQARSYNAYVMISIVAMCIGCANMVMPPAPPVTEPTVMSAEPTPPTSTRPEYHGLPTGAGSRISLRQIEQAMRNIDNFQLSAGPVSPARLQRAAHKARLNGILITHCTTEHLKVLVAMNRPPVVILRNPVGGPHFWAITAYDDNIQQMTLVNPLQNSTIRLEYDDFEQYWNAALEYRSCLIISKQAMTPEYLRIELAKYLPEEQLNSLKIRD